MTGHTYERRRKGRFDSEVGGSTAADVGSAAAGINPHRKQERKIQRELCRATLTIDPFVAAEDVEMGEPSSSNTSSNDEFNEAEDESFRPRVA